MLRPLLAALTLTVAGVAFSAPAAATDLAPAPAPVKKAPRTKTGIRWKVSPDSVVVYVDGKRVGVAKNLDVTRTKPGARTVRLVNGEDEAEFAVNVAKGQVVELRYEFTDG